MSATASIKRSVVRGSIWTICGYGLSMVIRLASTLILSRLLFPQAFGLMTTVSTIITGLTMLSDVGIDNSIIQSKRGDESDYLNTAWTLKLMRGIALVLVSVLLSGPIANFYGEPDLQWMLIATSFTLVTHGIESISLLHLQRQLEVKKLTLLDLGAQTLTTVLNILVAWIYPSIWVLVIGTLVTAFVRLLVSHTLLRTVRDRFYYCRDCARDIMFYGRWIFLSSSLHFLSRQADRLIIGEVLGMAQLGVYSIAVLISEAAVELANQLAHRVLYPALNQVARVRPHDLGAAYYRTRLRSDALLLPAIGFLAATSFQIIDFLYDARYAEAGWMLQMLSIRAATYAVVAPCESYIFALGQLRYGAIRSGARTVWILTAVPLAWYIGGLKWLVGAVAVSEVPVLLMLWQACSRFGALRPERELVALLMFVLGYLTGQAVVALLGK